MNFCKAPALPSLASQAPAGEGSRSCPAGKGVCSSGCRRGLPVWLPAGWVHGFFPAVFVSCGAAFSSGYTLLSREADLRSKALPVPWRSPCAAGYRDGSGSPVSVEGKVFSAPRPVWAPG